MGLSNSRQTSWEQQAIDPRLNIQSLLQEALTKHNEKMPYLYAPNLKTTKWMSAREIAISSSIPTDCWQACQAPGADM